MARRIFFLAVTLALTSLTFAKQPQWRSATQALTVGPSAAAFTIAADVNLAPQAGPVAPSTGNGATQTFSFQYSDANGAADLRMAKALFNTAVSYNQACVLTYDPHAAVAYLQSENGTLGPLAMGSANTLQNSYCSVNLAQSSASAGGDTLMVNWAITFGPGFVGEKNIYALAQDNSGVNSPWQLLGTWMPAAAVNTPPSVLSVTPNNGNGTTQKFSFQYSDVNGVGYLRMVKALFNTNTSYNQGCVVTYDPHASVVYLQSESGTLGPLPIGSTNTLQNPYCGVSLGQSSASSSGNTLTLNLALAFQPGFVGTKAIYGLAQDNAGVNSPWQVLGSWLP